MFLWAGTRQTNRLTGPPWLLCASVSSRECLHHIARIGCRCSRISWTIYIDTMYACPDKPYDRQIGVYSTALLFGDYIRPLLSIFAMITVACFAYAGHVNGQGPAFYIASVAFPAANMAWQLLATADFEKEGTKLFKVG